MVSVSVFLPLGKRIRRACTNFSILFFLVFFANGSAPNLAFGQQFIQQTVLMPEILSERRLDYLSDASAVGWNPALLGVRKHFDLTLATTISANSLSLSGNVGVFAKFSGIGLGYTISPAIIGSSGELYAGYGLRIVDDVLWVGVSTRLSLMQTPFFDYSASLLARPLPALLVSAGASTMTMNTFSERERSFTRVAENLMQYNLMASYAVSPHFMLHFSGRSHSLQDIRRPEFELGASMSFLDAALIVSGNIRIVQPALRLGIDINSDLFDLSYAPNIQFPAPEASTQAASAQPTQHIVVAHFSGDNVHSVRQILDKPLDTELCIGKISPEMQESVGFLRSFSRTNPLLAESFEEQGFIKDSAQFFTTIRQQFYSRTLPQSSLPQSSLPQSAFSQSALSSNQQSSPKTAPIQASSGNASGFRLHIKRIDYAQYPRISVIAQITDSLGRIVEGAQIQDSSKVMLYSGILRDLQPILPEYRITSLQQLDTALSVPVDVVMLIDCSGSMKDKIAEVREKIDGCLQELRKSGADARIGGILYGTEILDVLQPTERFERFEELLARADATQRDEYTPAAMDELIGMKFRPDAERVGVVVTDEVMYRNRRPFVREAIMLKDLWRERISISKIIKPCSNNGSATAYLTLGREYDMSQPLANIFAGIGKATNLLSAIVLDPAPTAAFTFAVGRVQSMLETPQQARITFTDTENDNIVIGPFLSAADGTFLHALPRGRKYRVLVEPVQANGANTDTLGIIIRTLDATNAYTGDTLRQTFVLMPRTTLRGMVRDQFASPVQADLIVRDNTGFTFPPTATQRTSNNQPSGLYELPLMPGRKYTVTAVPVLSTVYQPLEYEIDTRGFKAGTAFEQNFTVQRIARFVQIEGRVQLEDPAPILDSSSQDTAQKSENPQSNTVRPKEQDRRGIRVIVKNQANQEILTNAETRSDGTYRLALLKGISAEITVEQEGFAPTRHRIFIRKADTTTSLRIVSVLRTRSTDDEETQAKRSLDTIISASISGQKILAANTSKPEISPVEEAPSNEKNLAPKKEVRLPENSIIRLSFADTKDILPIVIDENGKPSKRAWQKELDSLASTLKRELAQLSKVAIVGHTDDRASVDANRAEGWQRANFVMNELIQRGVPASLLIASSQGNSQLLARNKKEPDKTYRMRCRRVEILKIWSGK
jgi:outer membrane protein OmpA-like peptidoglycan-associated protein